MTMAEQLEQRGMKRGIERGMEKGIEQGKQALAAKLIKNGMPVEQVAQMAELSEDLLRSLAEVEDTQA